MKGGSLNADTTPEPDEGVSVAYEGGIMSSMSAWKKAVQQEKNGKEKQEQKETSKQNSTRKIRDRWAAGVEDLRVYIEFAMHHARRHENVKVNICDTYMVGVNVRSLISMNDTK